MKKRTAKRILCGVVAAVLICAAVWLAPIPLGMRYQVSPGNVKSMKVRRNGLWNPKNDTPLRDVVRAEKQKEILSYVGGLKASHRLSHGADGSAGKYAYDIDCYMSDGKWLLLSVSNSVLWVSEGGDVRYYNINFSANTLQALDGILADSLGPADSGTPQE